VPRTPAPSRLLAFAWLALLAPAACNRGPSVWSCEVPAGQSCVQWVEAAPDDNKEANQASCKKFGGIVHDDVCPIDDTVFGRCDSGSSSTVYYGMRDVQAVSFRCKAAGGTWYGARPR
jgi:hypothetical protein